MVWMEENMIDAGHCRVIPGHDYVRLMFVKI